MIIKKLYKVTKVTPLSNPERKIRLGLLGISGWKATARKIELDFPSTHFCRHKVDFRLILGSYWLALVRKP